MNFLICTNFCQYTVLRTYLPTIRYCAHSSRAGNKLDLRILSHSSWEAPSSVRGVSEGTFDFSTHDPEQLQTERGCGLGELQPKRLEPKWIYFFFLLLGGDCHVGAGTKSTLKNVSGSSKSVPVIFISHFWERANSRKAKNNRQHNSQIGSECHDRSESNPIPN